MNKSIKAVLIAALLAAGPGIATSADSQVVIVNKSDWEIHQLFLSTVDEEEWGPDQLGEEVIPAGGGRFTLRRIPCASYDVQLIDEDGDTCVVGDVGLCGDSDTWVISNKDLLACQAATE
jgi:hypothetical protein